MKTWGKILAFGGLAIFVFLMLAVATIDQKSLKKQNDLSACDERFAGNNALRSDCRSQKIQGWIAEERAADCDAMHRDETGVWVWSKTPEERAACQAGEKR